LPPTRDFQARRGRDGRVQLLALLGLPCRHLLGRLLGPAPAHRCRSSMPAPRRTVCLAAAPGSTQRERGYRSGSLERSAAAQARRLGCWQVMVQQMGADRSSRQG
jgi:hypothetical protein